MAHSDSKTSYAGDLSPREAWALLEREPLAQLVDVRTTAEWSFVGTPDLSGLGRQAELVEWQIFPDLRRNANFVATVTERLGRANQDGAADRERPVLFLCRSGGRSRAAAMAMKEAGFDRAYNVAGGFEGDPDAAGHRGTINGWKAAGLPWREN